MKPITLDEKYVEQMRKDIFAQIMKELGLDEITKEVNDSLKKIRMSDGSFSFSKNFKFERKFAGEKAKQRVSIKFTPEAFNKMLLIIMNEEKEVGWHGVSERVSETEFVIKDILVYPQQVTAVTVDTDEEEYAKWLIKIGEDAFNNLHFHGHSHVNMGVTPSSTDMGHRQDITSQLGSEDYYIFMIWNKSLRWSAAVYDMKTNIQYETDDVDVVIPFSDGTTAGDLIRELKDKVKPYVAPVTKYPTYQGSSWSGGSCYQSSSYTIKKEDKKNEVERPKSWWEEEQERRMSAAGNGRDEFRNGQGYYGYYYDW